MFDTIVEFVESCGGVVVECGRYIKCGGGSRYVYKYEVELKCGVVVPFDVCDGFVLIGNMFFNCVEADSMERIRAYVESSRDDFLSGL